MQKDAVGAADFEGAKEAVASIRDAGSPKRRNSPPSFASFRLHLLQNQNKETSLSSFLYMGISIWSVEGAAVKRRSKSLLELFK